MKSLIVIMIQALFVLTLINPGAAQTYKNIKSIKKAGAKSFNKEAVLKLKLGQKGFIVINGKVPMFDSSGNIIRVKVPGKLANRMKKLDKNKFYTYKIKINKFDKKGDLEGYILTFGD